LRIAKYGLYIRLVLCPIITDPFHSDMIQKFIEFEVKHFTM